MANNKPKLFISRPVDKSFEAFKKWITDLGTELGAKGDKLSDDELRETWEKFWGKT